MNFLPSKAFLDTTILVDALMKQSAIGEKARGAIASCDETLLPVYAIKEFKAGALRNYVWFHNKAVVAATWGDAVAAIGALTMHHNKKATALGALAEFSSSLTKVLPKDWAAKYPDQNVGEIEKREGRIWLRTVIMRAWRNRRKLTSAVVSPLSCYDERDTLKVRNNGTIDDTPVICQTDDCCMRVPFIKRSDDVENLLNAADAMPDKNENIKRRAVLRQLHKHPGRFVTNDQCRSLGDAVFAMQCPKDAVVLTTNIKDHEPLSSAVGIKVVAP